MTLPVALSTLPGALPIQESETPYGLTIVLSTLPGALPVRIVTTGGVPCLDVLGGIFTAISLTASSIAEDASINDVVGALSVTGGSGTYTFTITADPDNKFAISVANLIIDQLLDYETATSHSLTIQADNGVDTPISRVFSIAVTDVSEGALPLMDFSAISNSMYVALLEDF